MIDWATAWELHPILTSLVVVAGLVAWVYVWKRVWWDDRPGQEKREEANEGEAPPVA